MVSNYQQINIRDLQVKQANRPENGQIRRMTVGIFW
jgi:hypothetical protein